MTSYKKPMTGVSIITTKLMRHLPDRVYNTSLSNFVRSDYSVAQGLPVSVLQLSDECVMHHAIGPPLVSKPEMPHAFWQYLFSLGDEWVWEDRKTEEKEDLRWLVDALHNLCCVAQTALSIEIKPPMSVVLSGWSSVQNLGKGFEGPSLKYHPQLVLIKDSCWVWQLCIRSSGLWASFIIWKLFQKWCAVIILGLSKSPQTSPYQDWCATSRSTSGYMIFEAPQPVPFPIWACGFTPRQT